MLLTIEAQRLPVSTPNRSTFSSMGKTYSLTLQLILNSNKAGKCIGEFYHYHLDSQARGNSDLHLSFLRASEIMSI